jgi:hypothetical protein
MSDRLHLIDPDPRRGCDLGCVACAQLDADFASIRRHALQAKVNETLADLAFISQHGYAPTRVKGGQDPAARGARVSEHPVRGMASVGVVDGSA